MSDTKTVVTTSFLHHMIYQYLVGYYGSMSDAHDRLNALKPDDKKIMFDKARMALSNRDSSWLGNSGSGRTKAANFIDRYKTYAHLNVSTINASVLYKMLAHALGTSEQRIIEKCASDKWFEYSHRVALGFMLSIPKKELTREKCYFLLPHDWRSDSAATRLFEYIQKMRTDHHTTAKKAPAPAPVSFDFGALPRNDVSGLTTWARP